MNYRKRAILAKIETVYGTDAVPTGAADACLVRNLNVRPMENNMVDRELIQAYLGHSAQLPVGTQMLADFEIEMVGSGTAGTAPAWGKLVRASAFAETINAGVSVVYNPVSEGHESITIYYHLDGVRHKLLGARGSVAMKISPKGIPVFAFKFVALYGGVADVAMPSQTLTAWKTPVAVNNANTSAFALHGYAGKLYDQSVDLANSVVHRDLVGAEDVVITDRAPAGEIEIEAPTITSKDFFTIAKNATLGALTITHGVTAGYKVKFDAPTAQIINPDYTDRDGIAGLKMGLRFVPGAGNDELTITAL